MPVWPQPMVLPDYGSGSLPDLLPAMAARLGVPGHQDVLGLPPGQRWVLMLVDGLGDLLLEQAAEVAPYLAALRGRTLTCGVPSTTVTSLTCLGTGTPPGAHGMAGYMFRIPQTGEILNALTWNTHLPAQQVQPTATVFERARAAGVRVTSVSPARFEGSGLTVAALRGPEFCGIDDEHDEELRVRETVAAASGPDRCLVYAYERELDHTGHGRGVAHPDWRTHLARIDAQCARLRAELPEDVRLVITGDHGMIDVPGRNFLIVEDEPGLMAEVHGLGGEGRLRQLYTDNAEAVSERWAQRLGDHAWVRRRDDAVDEGWFGPVTDRNRQRFGDVLVAMRTDWAVMSRSLSHEFDLVGMHGSLTPVEMLVPLLVD